MTSQILAGQAPTGISLDADVNNDARIGMEEMIYILQTVSGLRE